MMDESPVKRPKEMTNLEMEAQNLVHEEILGPEVTNEQRYENMLAGRKNRKAVSQIIISYRYRANNCTNS